MKKIYLFSILCVLSVYLIGCLTSESKEYTYKLDSDRSGHGSIKYINILSDNKDSVSNIDSDYQDLIQSYLKGDKIKEDLAGAKNIKTRLYDEDNQLCGEVSFDFDDITKLKFYKYKDTGPWCFYLSAFSMGLLGNSENYFSSNGTYGGENLPVIFWDGSQKEFNFKTTLTAPGKTAVSLLQMWKDKGEN
jgi:hypothetical protein